MKVSHTGGPINNRWSYQKQAELSDTGGAITQVALSRLVELSDIAGAIKHRQSNQTEVELSHISSAIKNRWSYQRKVIRHTRGNETQV